MKPIFFLFIFFAPYFSYSQTEVPLYKDSDLVFSNVAGRYTYKYLPEHKIPHWIAYTLTVADMTGEAPRSSRFNVNPLLQEMNLPWASSTDYTNSGYDRGHLLPSADRTSSVEANKATFLMTNVAPQTKALNQRTWKYLEDQVRTWARTVDTVFVACGTIIDTKDNKTVGRGVTIPKLFFKAILLKKGNQKAINCFVMPNDTILNKDFKTYRVSLDSLEKVANIDLIWNNQSK